MPGHKLRFAVFGCGFWAGYQVPAWLEMQDEAELVALCDSQRERASALAERFSIPLVYDDANELLDRHAHELDFVDIITDVHTHAAFTEKALHKGLHVISQKPMAPDLPTAKDMVDQCQRSGVRFFVHENFRWQAPVRKVASLLRSGVIGKPFKSRISFLTAYPVFANQPVLRELEDMIIADLGSHTFDIARFLFGEVDHLYSQIQRISPGIRGEDVASTLLTHSNGVRNFVEMSFATRHPQDRFPQVQMMIEGERGSIRLDSNFLITTCTPEETTVESAPPADYAWANPDYLVVHSSIVDCNRNILSDLQGREQAETTGADNLKTLELVYAAYDSARNNKVVFIKTAKD